MKKTILFFTASFLVTFKILAQVDPSQYPSYTNGKNNAVAFGINIPVGEFSKTHIAGISLVYSRSRHRFGNLRALPKKLIGFTANGGIDYYFGKKEVVAGYEYRYGGYLYLRAMGGVIFNPCKRGNITLTAGPTLGIYKDSADLGFGLILGGRYYLTNTIALAPLIIFLKHHDATALWVGAIHAAYTF